MLINKTNEKMIQDYEKMFFREQFADKVLDYTSNYNNKGIIPSIIPYGLENICGRPVRYPEYGRCPYTGMLRSYGTWWSTSEGAQKNYRPQDVEDIVSEDYIILGFESAVIPDNITIYETFNPGAVVRIWGRYMDRNWYLLYEQPPTICQKTARKFVPTLNKIKEFINIVRIEFNQSLLTYHTSIDAVEMSGHYPHTESEPFLIRHRQFTTIEPDGEDFFEMLPYEVLVHIFQYLDLKSLARCAVVNKRWHEATLNSSIYQNINLKKYWVMVDNYTLCYLKPRCKQLRKLDLSWCGNSHEITEKVFNDFLKHCGRQLTHLSLCNCKFIKNLLEISNCSALTELRLRNSFPGSWTYTFLSNLTKLIVLDLNATEINDEMLIKILKANQQLEHLNIDFCENLIKMDQITETVSIYNSKLVTFSCWKTRTLTARGVKHLSKCNQLREIDMGWCLAKGQPEDCLERLAQGCPDLRRLIVTYWYNMSDHHLLPIIKSCKNLMQLDLLGIKNISTDTCKLALATLQKLKLLDINYCESILIKEVELMREMYPEVIIQGSCLRRNTLNVL